MSFKPGDKVVFDWSKDVNKFDITTDSMRQVRELYGEHTSKVFTIKELGTFGFYFMEINNFFKRERFKKARCWDIEFKKRKKYV